uniref:Ribosomal protein L21 n=1 Tax=Opuntia streptacantha TaxID=393608 RepID=A0A7C9D541_OPUST
MASATLASSSVFAKCSLTHKQNPLSFSLSKPNCSFLSPSLPPSSLSLSRPSLDPATPQTQRPTFELQAKLTQEQYIKILKSISPYGEDVDLKEIAAKIYKRRNKPKRQLGSADIFAVVMIGSRQYIVIPGRWIHTQRLKGANVNDKIVLNKVLLVGTKDKTYVGYPLVTNCVVHAVVEEQLLDDKVIVFKYKKKKHYSRNIGHRQPITCIRITGITGYEDYPASTLDTADVTDS